MNGLNNYYFDNNSILKIRPNIQTVGNWVNETNSMLFLSSGQCYLTNASSLTDGIKESVNKGIWISLSTDARESTMKEACMFQHFPDCWIAPIIRISLWENFDFEIIMSTFQKSWRSEDFLDI